MLVADMAKGWENITGRLRLASLQSGDSGCWDEHRMLVLSELQRLRESYKSVSGKLDSINGLLGQIRVDVAKMQVKAGIWGAVAGIIPVIAAILLYQLRG